MEGFRRAVLGAAAGALSGLVVGGIGGRLMMSVLAAMNPQAEGVTSDDGFTMGQVTAAGTANLLFVTTVIGGVAGLCWVVLRGLRFGPPWWRAVSMPAGAGIVVGDQLVHSDGVDFTLLDPAWLAVVLTVTVPVLATVAVSWLGDRWIADNRTTWQGLPAVVPWVARAAVVVLLAASAVSLAGDVRAVV